MEITITLSQLVQIISWILDSKNITPSGFVGFISLIKHIRTVTGFALQQAKMTGDAFRPLLDYVEAKVKEKGATENKLFNICWYETPDMGSNQFRATVKAPSILDALSKLDRYLDARGIPSILDHRAQYLDASMVNDTADEVNLFYRTSGGQEFYRY